MATLVSIAPPTMLETDALYSDRAPEAVLQAADRITVHSGNIVSWNKLRRKAALTTTDELVLGTEAALKSWMGRERETELQSELTIRNTALCQKVGQEEREGFLFTLKVFLASWDGRVIHTAVQQTLEELGLRRVGAVIVAFPLTSAEEQPMDAMKAVWKFMEQLVRDDITNTISTADLMKPQLEELYHWAEIKPTADQLNLAHCCTIPEDLTVFSKQHNIMLYTHNDERDILPPPQLQRVVGGVWGGHDDQWNYSWCARYSSVVRMRGIIAHKGYLVELQKQA